MRRFELKSSFPSFNNNFIPVKDMKSETNSWSDGGGDAFDTWGNLSLYLGGAKAHIPFSTYNGPDGTIYTQNTTLHGVSWEIKHGWAVQGIFVLQIKRRDSGTSRFKVGISGNFGSDGSSQYGTVRKSFQGSYYMHTHWNSDRSLDTATGDPQVTWTAISMDCNENSSSDTDTFSRSGDGETSYTKTFSKGIIVVIQWGHTSVSAVQTWISNAVVEELKAVRVKQGGNYKQCKVYVKKNGSYMQVKKLYVKQNGVYKLLT